MLRRLFQALRPPRKRHLRESAGNHSPPTCPSTLLPAEGPPIDEEGLPEYDSDEFYPVHLGEIFNQRYKIISKLGYGRMSTVWLAKDNAHWFWQPHKYVALKVSTSRRLQISAIQRELEVSRIIKEHSADPDYALLRPALDNFEIRRKDGAVHCCVTYAVMREPMNEFRSRWPDGKIPPVFVKVYMTFILKALNLLHTKCEYIHGDLKMDNLLMSFEEPSIVQEYVRKLDSNSVPRKIIGNRTTYLARNDFGPIRSLLLILKVVDYDRAEPGNQEEPMRHPMQSAFCRAPEVLVGIPWSYSIDIWNAGVLMWNMMEGRDLFTKLGGDHGYDARANIAEMIALLGSPPREFLENEKAWRHIPWERRLLNDAGKICVLPQEYWAGPFFDDDGHFLFEDKIPTDFSLSDTVQALEGDEKALFLDFARQMLQWLPEHRKTAKELLGHPWLDLGAGSSPV